MTTLTLKVEGMSCGGCVASVTRVLTALPGVSDATVRLLGGTAQVTFDEALTNPAALRAAIESAGYEVA
ncbi:MAG TPA: heavy-metal-associated domain-containing protein [Casimicrobiaceae bacterium]|nr:heavy-metal-associated domain-containing protein [Casimicrobiaceae bacterium]